MSTPAMQSVRRKTHVDEASVTENAKADITIYIVDDDEDVLQSLAWLVESVGYQVNIHSDCATFLTAYNPEKLSCLILDVRMQGLSGLELQEHLLEKNITIPIIFITGHGDVPMAVRAMKKGAVDFLTKPVNNQVLLETINKAIAQDSVRRHRASISAQVQARAKTLTKRESEVLHLMVKGRFTKQIADDLGISPNTVELHRGKVMRKMGARSLAELVSLALLNRVVKIHPFRE